MLGRFVLFFSVGSSSQEWLFLGFLMICVYTLIYYLVVLCKPAKSIGDYPADVICGRCIKCVF